ncbi:AlpA family transcriptional regulator [Pseudomonas sp. H9]|uniref:helix-turn-helix transcriptional regulator n=1 Tax=Pseudomonas sp. H9 TaxID=483968 RepID=UPI0010579E29|nr:AlpA family phage regulatory protein [Pseudomonas sp. H9]TDF78538.1 AlpA family phage regulatory protein [Pseudomonas sp. H9]
MNELDRFIRVSEVLLFTSFSRTTLWREMKAGRFPNSVQISAGRMAWRTSELAAWQKDPENWKSRR